ncbi:hypothetical protein VTN77DRAFT_8573 [Rasamsonia byssochlamydoides]|uniref:uncharacterized protein n=1 Tax=Rasamsonia byssochlamydoides TaxID=89139 RepID=UPI003743F699
MNNEDGEVAPPPPYHNWQEAVPDTATFPPPPAPSFLYSTTGNASSDDAERAHYFCDNTPLWKPVKPSDVVYSNVQRSTFRLIQPPEFKGTLTTISNGRWRGRSREDCHDCVLITSLPLYFSVHDSPFVTERSKTIYFEVKLLRLDERARTDTADACGLSIGFLAQPYPTWRSPGWERASVGVFSDDGCRFVNDSFGGKEFTTPFNVGETVGLGMTFELPDAGDLQHRVGSTSASRVRIFFTRNGREVGGWDLHEEVDEDAGSVEGLEGDYDLYGAVGLFGGVEFEACFDKAGWMWKPPF